MSAVCVDPHRCCLCSSLGYCNICCQASLGWHWYSLHGKYCVAYASCCELCWHHANMMLLISCVQPEPSMCSYAPPHTIGVCNSMDGSHSCTLSAQPVGIVAIVIPCPAQPFLFLLISVLMQSQCVLCLLLTLFRSAAWQCLAGLACQRENFTASCGGAYVWCRM